MITRDKIEEKLKTVVDATSGTDIVTAGMVSGMVIREGRVGFVVTLPPEEKHRAESLQKACESAVMGLESVTQVTVVMTAQNAPDAPVSISEAAAAPKEPKVRAQWNLSPLPHVRAVVAVASGKGGVGKSTTSVNLAHALQEIGVAVGLLDADIYGPSLPRMMGLNVTPDTEGGIILPPVAHGIPCMSMGFLTPEDGALVWRGPMLSKALTQMLRGVQWGTARHPLEVLLVDMPPGTGDVHLSMAQLVPITAALMVTTPQPVATIDAQKCAQMFVKMNIPLAGVVENMSWLEQPDGSRLALFGEGGGAMMAEKFGCPLLAQLPLDTALRQAADEGQRLTPSARWRALAEALMHRLETSGAA